MTYILLALTFNLIKEEHIHNWKLAEYDGHPYLICTSCKEIDPMFEQL